MQRRQEGQQRNDQGEDADVPVAPGKYRQQQPAKQRREGHHREDGRAEVVGAHCPTPIQIMKAMITAEPAAIQPA